MKWRVVDTGLSEPEFTVAADEAIAIARSGDRVPNTIHLYRRNRPTVSLGYFQEVAKATDINYCRRNGVRIVRRISGGSAVYTDSGHLIYGLIVSEDALPSDRLKAFGKACSAIVDALGQMGILATFKPVNDVLVDGRKISGSAQTRHGSVVLQHGTLIIRNEPGTMQRALRMDEAKMLARGLEPSNYVTSLAEVMGAEPDVEMVKRSLVKGFENVFRVETESACLTEFEMATMDRLVKEKYGRDEWNLRR